MLRKINPYILILPSLLVVSILFIGGLLVGLFQSFGLMNITGKSKFTITAYTQLFQSEDFHRSLLLTFRVSLISVILSGLIALLLVYLLFIADESKISKTLRRIFEIPMLVPHITAAYLIGILFMKSGWLSSIAFSIGITKNIEAFPSLINDINSWGIIFTYIWKETPFIMLMLFPVIQRVEDSWLEIAKVFGARRKDFFMQILFPLLIPTFISSMLIVFAFVFSDFEVPYILGVTYPKFVSVFAYDIYFNGELAARPIALASNFILVIITAILGSISFIITKKWNIQKEMRW